MIGTSAGSVTAQRVLVPRAVDQQDDLIVALRDRGLEPVPVPAIEVEFAPPGAGLEHAARLLHSYRWVVVTSANGARAILNAVGRFPVRAEMPRWAAVGASTRAVLEGEGVPVGFEPSHASGRALAAELPIGPRDKVLVVRGNLAGVDLIEGLRARGAQVDDVVAYRTREAPETSRRLLRAATAGGPIAAIVFTSGSTVRGLVALGDAESIDVRSIPSVCIGAGTADEARRAGFRILAVSPKADSTALAAATASVLAPDPKEMP